LVELIVDAPDKVTIDEIPGGDSLLVELEVATDDLGKVIGRQGRTIRALRTLLAARGTKDGERYELELVED
jgi:predicted RNA-binding protein YlqC (UPF0109 family)